MSASNGTVPHTDHRALALHHASMLVDEAGDICSFLAAADLPQEIHSRAGRVLANCRMELQTLAGEIEAAGPA